ncbi:hypothetical protein [Azospirillum sp. sgz302134]
MLPNIHLRVDDLTPDEAATVAHAYLAALDEGDHDSAFGVALDSLRAFRPELPETLAAVELEVLLSALPPSAPSAAMARDTFALA